MLFLFDRGRALADIVFGDYNPSGRLPITYPKHNHHLTTYDYKWTEVKIGNWIDVQFEFGHGLSYTTFQYSDLVVPATMNWDGTLNVAVTVRNSGARAGDHTVLMYVSDLYRTVTPPNKELKGYSKSSYDAGQQKVVQFTLTRADLSFIGIDLTRQTEAGLFTVRIGDLQANFTLNGGSQPTGTASTAKSSHEHFFALLAFHLFLFLTAMLA